MLIFIIVVIFVIFITSLSDVYGRHDSHTNYDNTHGFFMSVLYADDMTLCNLTPNCC